MKADKTGKIAAKEGVRKALASTLQTRTGPVYRIDISYVGTRYQGFQSQPGGRTIQDHIERALKIILGHPCRIRGASRTDSGVHAQHQVAIFKTHKPFSRRWLMGLNALTPDDIGVMSLDPAEEHFDPVCHSTGKAYRYRIWRGRCFNPFLKPYVWEVPEEICHQQLEQFAQAFVGRHDFAAFCNKDSDAKSTVREVLEIRTENHGPMIDIWLTGKGFLKQMIRIMVGTLAGTCIRNEGIESIKMMLGPHARRSISGLTAPAKGLCLVKVFYNTVEEVQTLVGQASSGFCQSIPDNHKIILSGKPIIRAQKEAPETRSPKPT